MTNNSYRLVMAAVTTFVTVTLVGCNTRPYVTKDRFDKGLVLILPGIEEHTGHSAMIRKGLYDGGLPYALEIYQWHKCAFGTAYAFDESGARSKARQLVERIADYRKEHPKLPVFLVGHSGGGAIVVFAAEETPEETPVDGIISISPALGPEYDLTRAVKGCRGNMAVCSASNDVFLRTLTTAGQNFDGTKGATAGQEGFRLPADASPERAAAFGRVRQIKWDASMAGQGNRGGHFGWTNPPWVASSLARQTADPARMGRIDHSPELRFS
jgi:pimeloyl-ACP methyl ester carboxylesterase